MRTVAGAAHVFIQVSLLQIHNLELQPLEDLFQGLAGPVVKLFTWEEMEHCACVVESWVVKGSGPRAGGRATRPRSSLKAQPQPQPLAEPLCGRPRRPQAGPSPQSRMVWPHPLLKGSGPLSRHTPFRSRQSMRCPRSVNSWESRVDGG